MKIYKDFCSNVRTVLITGANRGLGYELLKVFYYNNCVVFPLVRSEESANRLRKEFTNRCYPIVADIRSDDCKEIIKSTLENHTDKLDILINNAGIPGRAYQIENVSSGEVLDLLNVHCLGVIRTVQATIGFLENSTKPRIINVSSRLGSLSKMASGEFKNRNFSYSYRIAKAAQNMLTVCLDQEMKDLGICVVAIHPGKLKTYSGASDADMEPGEAARNIFNWVETLDINHSGIFVQPFTEQFQW